MKRLSILASLMLVMMTAMPMLALAEDEPGNLADMWVVTIKTGHTAAFEESLKAHMTFRSENGDTRDWQTFTVVAGDDLSKYYIRYCCFKWPDQDAYDALSDEKGLGAHWMENADQHVSGYEHYFSSIDRENSNWPADAGDFKYFGVTDWTPKPGNAGQRSAAMSTFTATANENGWDRIWSWSWRIGGSDQLSLVIPYKDFAAMVPPEQSFFEFMVEHAGEEAAKETFKNFSSSFWGSSYTIYAHRPDLSISNDD
jgi:hypothetical protein